MNTTRLRQVRRLFVLPGVPRHVVRHNCLAWVKSVRLLASTGHKLPVT